MAGAAFWLSCGTLLLLAIHPNWYADWQRKDTLDTMVAVGTLALAIATARAAFLTRSLIVHDDRRHRQALAPVVRISLAPGKPDPKTSPGLIAKNIGTGPALHVRVRAVFADSGRILEGHVSALGIGEGREIRHGVVGGVDHRRSVYGAISVQYENVFGNVYQTQYHDFKSLRFEYVPPPELR